MTGAQHQRAATEHHPQPVPNDPPAPHEAPLPERVVDQFDQLRIPIPMPVAGGAVMLAQASMEALVGGSIGLPGAGPTTQHPDHAHHPGGERRGGTDECDDREHRLAEHRGQDDRTERSHARADECRRRRERIERRSHRKRDRLVACVVGRRRPPAQFSMPRIADRSPDRRGVHVVARRRRRGVGGRDPQRDPTGTDSDDITGTDLHATHVVERGRGSVERDHVDRCPTGQLDDPDRPVDDEQRVMWFDRWIIEVQRQGGGSADAVATGRQRRPWSARGTGDDGELERTVAVGRRFVHGRSGDGSEPGALDERFDLDQWPLWRDDDATDLEPERGAHAQRVGEIGDRVTRRADLDPEAMVVGVDHVDGWDEVRFHPSEWVHSGPNGKTCSELGL